MSGKLSGEEEVTMKRDEKGMIIMKDEDTEEVIAASTFINNKEEGQVEVIFICDRSGSMCGEGITSLKETLQLFLRQLPEGSKFNIISFGSEYKLMFDDCIEYSDTTLANASNEVKQFQADFGGTNLLKPLQEAMKHKCQIIVLTDGCTSDKEKIIELCKNDRGNVVHMVGLGNSVDVDLVRTIPRLCGGLSALSKNPMKLKEAVSRITERILTPMINEPEAKWSVKGEQYPKNINKFNSDTTVFLKLDKEETLECELKGKIGDKTITLKNKCNEISKGNIVEQIYASMKLRELEANNQKEEAIKISLRYNVLSKYTSFISIDKFTKNEVKDIKIVKLEQKKEKDTYELDSEQKTIIETQKNDKFNALVKLQKVNGTFNNLETLYPSIQSLIEKHKDIDRVIIMTIVAITIFEKKYSSKKVEWDLLVKKAKKYLDKQQFDKQIYNEVEQFVSSL